MVVSEFRSRQEIKTGEALGFAPDSVANDQSESGGIPEVSSLYGLRISRLRSGRRWCEDE